MKTALKLETGEARLMVAAAVAKAAELGPDHPGPAFYYGIALARSGDLAAARREWGTALKKLPKDASYRNDMVTVMLKLDPGLAEAARQAPAAPAK